MVISCPVEYECLELSSELASIQRIDPIGTVQRRSIAVRNRVYHVSGENIEVWRTMMNIHNSHACVITGSSTHNERIERLWRDVHCSVIVTFADSFRELEAEQLLDSLNEVDVYCLHSVYSIVNHGQP